MPPPSPAAPSPATPSPEPQLIREERHESHLRRELWIDRNLTWFEGHFPEEAILAGVVQLKWALGAAAELRNDVSAPHSIQQLKFRAPIRPDTLLTLRIERRGPNGVGFRYSSASGEHASGWFEYSTR